MNQRAGLTTTPAPGDGAGLRLEINQQEIVGGWATGNGVIAWPESGKINRMHGDSRGQVKGVFGDCQFTCFPDCQLALSPDPAMNLFCGAGFIPASGVRPGRGVAPTPVGRGKPGPTVEAGPSFAAEAGSFFVGPGLSRPAESGLGVAWCPSPSAGA